MIASAHLPHSVAATITPAAATGTSWHAVVVGAGPAGAAAAWRLAAAGLRVLLVDRHPLPRGKVCGCCLSTRALRELDALGPEALPDTAIPLDTVRLAHRGRCTVIPLPAGRVVSREALDTHLVRQAIAAGCQWLPGVAVMAIHDTDDDTATSAVEVHATVAPAESPRRASIRAAMVVLATGLADHVRITDAATPADREPRRIAVGSRIGVGGVLAAAASDLPAGELLMAIGREGYCGIVRLDDGRLDVAAALDRAAVAREADPARAVTRLLGEAAPGSARHLPDADAILTAAFRATPALTRRAPLVTGRARRILRVGDAAGYIEPFTGEGMGWALASSRVLAESLLAPDGPRGPAEAAARYVAAHRREFASLHARCRFVAQGLRRPTLVAAAVCAARAMPWAARRLVPRMIGAGPRPTERLGGSR
jgi:menaquinone-9 beta-reductase